MPYKSEKQRAFFHTDTAKKKGITEKEVKEFDKASKGKKLPKEAKDHEHKSFDDRDKASKTDKYHGHEGVDHSHLSNQNLRGANLAHATRKVKLQSNHEECQGHGNHDSMAPEKLSPREDKDMKMKRKDDLHDKKMHKRK
jgi:hypothetical protein